VLLTNTLQEDKISLMDVADVGQGPDEGAEVLCAPVQEGDAHQVLCKQHSANEAITYLEVEITSTCSLAV